QVWCYGWRRGRSGHRNMSGIFRLIWRWIMAILALRKTGGGADFDRLTAVPEDVAAGKRFLGAGSDETQEGTMPVQGSPSIMLPANGSVTLPAGKYTGGKVSQQIATMGEQSIGPGAKQITN
ncbi:hypothetical protein CLOSTASPAR_06862, partial [[Clostridium] asparagiforme DSM 15981]